MARYRLRGRIPCIDGTRGVDTLPFAMEHPDEPVIVKRSFDGFLNTELHDVLTARGIKGLELSPAGRPAHERLHLREMESCSSSCSCSTASPHHAAAPDPRRRSIDHLQQRLDEHRRTTASNGRPSCWWRYASRDARRDRRIKSMTREHNLAAATTSSRSGCRRIRVIERDAKWGISRAGTTARK